MQQPLINACLLGADRDDRRSSGRTAQNAGAALNPHFLPVICKFFPAMQTSHVRSLVRFSILWRIRCYCHRKCSAGMEATEEKRMQKSEHRASIRRNSTSASFARTCSNRYLNDERCESHNSFRPASSLRHPIVGCRSAIRARGIPNLVKCILLRKGGEVVLFREMKCDRFDSFEVH